MTGDERWVRLRELFAAALLLEPDRRPSFLDANCGDDEALRREVESLLRYDVGAGADRADSIGAAVQAAAQEAVDRDPPSADSLAGTRVGHIRVLKLLGKGGMGEVYVGFDETLQRRVALKAIRHQRLSEESRARFLREARILSQLEHPNICRIHDYIEGGERDFLVLELIEGGNLSEVGEQLDDAKKMRVAIRIAEVLAAAHGKGVVHRDLKPQNVMVTPEGATKVLDFGLAGSVELENPDPTERSVPEWSSHPDASPTDSPTMFDSRVATLPLFDERESETATLATDQPRPGLDGLKTRPGQIFGTPVFMSPEQARGELVSTASDMYSFGLLLQVLFTGNSPHPTGLGGSEILERARKGETLAAVGVDSDLLALIQRLKSPAPANRPTAVETLARLQWIVGKPKRRFRRLIAVVVLALIALGVAKYTIDLRAARDEANRRRDQAENLLSFLVGDLRKSLEPIGRLDLLDAVGDRALEYFATARPEELTDQELSRQAQALTQIGEVRLNQRRYDEALDTFQKANLRSSALVSRHPSDGDRLFDRGQTEFWIGYVHWRRSQVDEARVWLTRYRDTCEALLQLDGSREDWIREVAYGHHNLAVLALEFDQLDRAKKAFEDEVGVLRRLIGVHPDDGSLREDLADAFSWLGTTARRSGQLGDAIDHFRRSAQQRAELLTEAPDNAQCRYWWAQAVVFQGRISSITGTAREAAEQYDEALSTLDALVSQDPGNREWTRIRSAARIYRADLMAGQGDRLTRASREAAAAVRDLETLVAAEPSDREARFTLAQAYRLQARIDFAASRFPTAKGSVARARETLKQLSLEASRDPRLPGEEASNLVLQGRLQEASGLAGPARTSWRAAVDLLNPRVQSSLFVDLLDPWTRALILIGDDERAVESMATLNGIGYRPIWAWPKQPGR